MIKSVLFLFFIFVCDSKIYAQNDEHLLLKAIKDMNKDLPKINSTLESENLCTQGNEVRVNEGFAPKNIEVEVSSSLLSLNLLLGEIRPVKTTVTISAVLDLRDSYNKHKNYEVVIGAYGIKEMNSEILAVAIHEYAHAVLYEYIKRNYINLDLDKIRKLLLPYNELFADLVACLYLNDPKAINKAIKYKNDKAKFRDFSQNVDIENWTIINGPGSPSSQYTQFDAIRSNIWRLFNSAPKNNKGELGLMLKDFLDSIVKHINLRVSRNDNGETKDQDIKKINKEFIDILSSTLKHE